MSATTLVPSYTSFATRLLLLCCQIASSGCSDRDVVAEVGRTKVTRAELDAFIDASGARFADDRAAALNALLERARLAEAARVANLAEEPLVRGRIDASRREILAAAYLDQVLAPATREDALRQRYEAEKERLARRRIHVAHIVTRPSGPGQDAHDAAQARIVKVYARLADGEPFANVAADLSEDEITRRRGGDLGPLLEGQVDAKFFDAAAALKAGETSRPFESSFAFHLVKALEDPRSETPTFEETRGQLAAESRREAEARVAEKLRSDMTPKIYADRLGTAAARPGTAGGKGP